jgi:hypothetical protein
VTRRLAQALVCRYPAAWRERYEREVSALIDDTTIRFRDLAELLRGLLTERARELVSAADRPRRTAAAIGLLKLGFVLAFVGSAIGLGLGLRQVTGPWSEAAREAGAMAVAVGLLFFVIIAISARHRGLFSSFPPYKAGTGAVLLVSLFAGLVFIVAGQLMVWEYRDRSRFAWLSAYSPWIQLFLYTNFLSDLCGSLWPSRRLLQAFAELELAEARLKTNQAWVDGCHEMIAKGVPSPLREAQEQVEHWTRERDAARVRVHALGYRARFRQDLGGSEAPA